MKSMSHTEVMAKDFMNKTKTPANLVMLAVLLFLSIATIPAFATYEPTGLTSTTQSASTITWTWTANNTYYNTSVYLNGVFQSNVTSPVTGTQTYQATGLNAKTSYTIGLLSTNMSGGYADTWTNNTQSTRGNVDFTDISGVILATVGLMPGILSLIVSVVPIMITISLISFILGIIAAILALIRGGF